MKPLGFLMIVVGIAILFGDDKKVPADPVHKRLNDSFRAEIEELDRMERQIREEVER